MGNSQTCVDCNTKVPTKVKWLDNIRKNWGLRYCKWAYNEIWIKLGSDKYLCSPCLVKRQNQERQKQQEEERRKENEKRQEEKRIHDENSQKQELERTQEERRRLQEKKRVENQRFNRQEEERENSKKRQFLLSEKRLADWERREKGTIHEREQSQIFKESLPKGNFHNLQIPFISKYISNSREEQQTDIVQQKDNGSVLQEMVDRGSINHTDSLTISHVLLIVQEKIKSYDNQNKFHRMRQPPDHQLIRRFCFKCFNFADHEKEFAYCIFEICLAVKLSKTYWPRNTQIVSLCLMIKGLQKGILLEINTGEGKTCIIAMFSAFLASSQIAVDIVSSSPILAQRDYDEWKRFYKMLKISVNSNLIPKKTAERLKCYSNKVVYGTVASFASDLLRQTFLMENVRGERKCEAVIVDEADCMLLDQGVHFTYLSHSVPGMHHIEPILFMIWKQIVKHERIVSDKSENFFLGVLDSLQVVLSSYVDLSELFMEANIPPEIQWLYQFEENNHLSVDFTKHALNGNNSNYKDIFTIEKIIECLKFVEENFSLPISFQPYIILNETTVQAVQREHSINGTKGQIIHLLVVGEGLVCVLHPYEKENEIHYFVKKQIKNYISYDGSNKTKHHIPGYLKEYVENRLISWIENAFTAKYMLIGREYLVTDNDVVPVDFESTGVVQFGTKWGDCLHQFLEIKHRKKLSPITLVTNFMSNQEYFCRYKGKIFGVSGTLGTEREKSFLMKQFSLSSQTIPTHRSKVFEELPGIICNSKHEWIIAINDVVRDHVTETANKTKRAVLVICEDINTAKELQTNLMETVCASATLYTRNDENNDKIDSKLKAGDIIVATNIAGRGTDIDIDEMVEKAGGLFVLVTFLPQNSRIENQVFGRSARKGQPGSGQIVLNRHSLPSYFSLHELTCIESLKHLRDAIEEKRIVDIEKHAFEEVRLKENLFGHYCSFLCEIKQLYFKGVDANIMLDSLHEYWGMWLKMNCDTRENLVRTKNLKSSLNDALKIATRKLCRRISPCFNASHIIKFANEQLFDKNYDRSEFLFTKAIEIDKKWAAISFYNRAYCTLLSRKQGYIAKAIDDLSNSQECFALFKEEAVLCLTLSSSMNDENNNEEEVNGTASQFNSRCQIINYFEENITVSLQQLREFQKANKDATAESTSIFTIVLGDNTTSKKIESEIYVFWEMGLTQLIFVKERKPFCWKGMLVVALGVLQIAVGAVIVASSAGILTQLGWGLIAEGVNDICSGAYAVWENDQEFMKSWMVGKAISIAVSVASFGYNQAKTATKGVKGVRATVAALKQNVKTGAKKAISEFKTIGTMISSKSFGPTFRTTCVGVGTEVGKQLSRRGGKYILEIAQEKVSTLFEDIARENIKQEIMIAFTEGDMYPVVDDFIAFHLKGNTQKDQISAKYIDITKNLLSSENICQFRQVLLGCVKDVIKTTSKQMKKKQTDIFEQCKPIFDIINEIACAKYDIRHLVSVYCKNVNSALKDIYEDSLTNEAFSYFKADDHDLCTIKQQIIDQTAKYLYSLLKESFQFTGSGILAEKLQGAVGRCVNEYASKNIGKETIGKIIAISSKAGQIGKDLATTGTIDVKTVVETGLDAAETVVDLVTDEKTKKIIGFGLNTAKTSMHALQSSKPCDAFDAVTDIAADGIDKFANDDLKRKADFALNTAKRGVSAYKSGKSEDIFDAVTDITADGIDKFANDGLKRKANFALNAAKRGASAYRSGKSEDIFDAVTDITGDGIEKFANDDLKRRANFALNTAKRGASAYRSGKSEDIFDAVTDITADGIEKFANDDVKRKADFALNTAKRGVSAYRSGKSEDIFDAVTDITADGIEKFANNDVKRRANFALNATKIGVKALQSEECEKIIDAAANIAADGINKFVDDDMKNRANFALNATTKGIKSLQSGESEKMFDAVADIAADGIEKFADDDVKCKVKCARNAT